MRRRAIGVKVKFQRTSPTWSSVLSTRGLIFSGDVEGNFIAFDAASLKPLWHFQKGGAVYAPPIAFAVDGKETMWQSLRAAPYSPSRFRNQPRLSCLRMRKGRFGGDWNNTN